LREHAPEACASANSATPARKQAICKSAQIPYSLANPSLSINQTGAICYSDLMNNTNNGSKTQQNFLDLATNSVAGFIGSWWGVFSHTIWFVSWFIFNLDMNTLTFAVSLEAIFIGIFLLISDNRAEAQRDKREYAAQKRESNLTEILVDSVEKLNHRQQQILQLISELQQDVSEIKIKTLKKSKIKAEIKG
jgi:uncharacterized membrane protein